MEELQNRISEALNINNMKAVELAERTGLSASSISSWIKQRWQPKQNALNKMARVLDVSEMWLAGYDTPMERPHAQKVADQYADIVKALRNNEKLANTVSELSKNEKLASTVDYLLQLDADQYVLIENMIHQLKKD